MDNDFLIGVTVGLLMGVVLCTGTFIATARYYRAEACKQGVAEWVVVNNATGEAEFRWKEAK